MNVTERTKKLQVVRNDGKIPGVIYGKGIDSKPIQVDEKDFMKTLHENSTSKTFSITFDGKKHIVYIKDYQPDYMHQSKILHFDLLKVSATDTLQSSVPIHLLGKEKFEKSTSIISSSIEELEIEYAVGKGISHIDIDISELTLNDALLVKDVIVPEGVKILNDSEQMIVHLIESRMEEEPEESDVQAGIVTDSTNEDNEE